jgi:hypothetical protein
MSRAKKDWPAFDAEAREALARGETIDNATGRPIPVGPAALGEPGGPLSRSLYLYENVGVPWNRDYLRQSAPTVRPGRSPGRPKWPHDLLRTRYREAVAATEPPRTVAALAAHFRALDGTMGVTPDHLRELRRKLPPGDLE